MSLLETASNGRPDILVSGPQLATQLGRDLTRRDKCSDDRLHEIGEDRVLGRDRRERQAKLELVVSGNGTLGDDTAVGRFDVFSLEGVGRLAESVDGLRDLALVEAFSGLEQDRESVEVLVAQKSLGEQDEVGDVGLTVTVARTHLVAVVHKEHKADLLRGPGSEILLEQRDIDPALAAELECDFMSLDRHDDDLGDVRAATKAVGGDLSVSSFTFRQILIIRDLLEIQTQTETDEGLAVAVEREVAVVSGREQMLPLLPRDCLLLARVGHQGEAVSLVQVMEHGVHAQVRGVGLGRGIHTVTHTQRNAGVELPDDYGPEGLNDEFEVRIHEGPLVVIGPVLRDPERALRVSPEVGVDGGEKGEKIEVGRDHDSLLLDCKVRLLYFRVDERVYYK